MGKYQEKSGLCLARLFSDHAVLQREIPVPVWGWTRPGVRVQVKLGPYEAETRSGSDGRFMARLPPMPAGGPYELDVSTPEPAERVRVRDVMVGEVWVCSGQSNMEWRVKNVTQDTQKLTGVDQRIRTVNVPQRAQLDRPQDVDVSWLVADSQTVGDFSAVAFFFARRLSQELGVAVGLINASWGGTRIETWISREELVRHTRTRNEVARYESSVSSVGYWHRFDPLDPDHPQVMERLMQECFPGDPENTGFRDKWAAVGFDDSSWTAVEQPGSWTSLGYGTNGVFWFRREITIPADWAGKDLTLALGAIDKQDTTYFNGEQVGKDGKRL
jgi:sialate O-acetylesterase